MRRGIAHRRTASLLSFTITIAAGLSIVGCKSDAALDPSKPPSGLVTSQDVMKDGAGNAGPVKVTLQTVSPALGSAVSGDINRKCDAGSPYACFDLIAEYCMDPVANPTSSAWLSAMEIGVFWSADGVTALLHNGIPFDITPTPGEKSVASGTCVTVQTSQGRRAQFPLPSDGTPRFLILTASYGGMRNAITVNASACPTPAAITASNPPSRPACAFRRVYDLGYHF